MLYGERKFTNKLDSTGDHFSNKIGRNGTKNWPKIVPSWNRKPLKNASSAESKTRILGL